MLRLRFHFLSMADDIGSRCAADELVNQHTPDLDENCIDNNLELQLKRNEKTIRNK